MRAGSESDRNGVLKKKKHQSLLACSTSAKERPLEDTERKWIVCKQNRKPSLKSNYAGTLILDKPQNYKEINLLFKSFTVCHFIIGEKRIYCL